jgi:hypothetical protein
MADPQPLDFEDYGSWQERLRALADLPYAKVSPSKLANWYVSGLSAEETISLVVDHLLEKEK